MQTQVACRPMFRRQLRHPPTAPLQRRGRWQNQSGPPGGSRVHKAAKGKGRVPGTWQPKMSNPARRALMDAGLCLCCKESTEHTWRDCPRNPDNRGNA